MVDSLNSFCIFLLNTSFNCMTAQNVTRIQRTHPAPVFNHECCHNTKIVAKGRPPKTPRCAKERNMLPQLSEIVAKVQQSVPKQVTQGRQGDSKAPQRAPRRASKGCLGQAREQQRATTKKTEAEASDVHKKATVQTLKCQ